MRQTEVQIPGVVAVPLARVGVFRHVAHGGKGHLVRRRPHMPGVVAHQVRLDVVLDVTDDVFGVSG